MHQFSLSVVLPVGVESRTLATTVAECLSLVAQHGADLELIIADDRSDAAAAAVADRLAATHSSVAVIRYPRRRGYRQTLHDAWGAARGEYIAALDIAGPAAAADIARLLPAAPAHAAILGYRVPPPRRLAEVLFAAALGVRVTPEVRDPSLGLGLFRADLRDLLSPDGPAALAHAEIYAAARRRGLAVTQVAVAGKAARVAPPSLADLASALAYRDAAARAGADPERHARQGAAVGAGVILAAGGVWLLRRLRRLP